MILSDQVKSYEGVRVLAVICEALHKSREQCQSERKGVHGLAG